MSKPEASDVVQLKSGGPAMSVVSVGTGEYEGRVECQWFGGHEVKTGSFAVVALQKVDPKGSLLA